MIPDVLKNLPEPIPDETYPDPAPLSNHIILCGLRNLGFRILEQLLISDLAVSVVVIDPEPEMRFAEEAAYLNVRLLRRDSRVASVLREAGIERARALITVLDDLKNLETVLEARRLAPDLPMVAGYSNSQVGELINRLPNCKALNPAALTADTFVTASLPNQVLHLFKLNDKRQTEEIAVVRDQPNQPGSISQLYGRIVPIQVQADDGRLNVCPPPGTTVGLSDRVVLIGRPEDLLASQEVELNKRDLERSQGWYQDKQPRRSRLRRWRALTAHFFSEMGPRFRLVLILFLGIMLLCALVLVFLRGDTLADGLYLALNIVVGQPTFTKDDYWSYKIFGFFATLTGIVLLAVVNAYITNYIVTARLAQALGQQKATDMKGHTILVGLGDVGYQVLLDLLERGERVVVLDREDNNPYTGLARRKGVPVIQADARLPGSLDLANISNARCITVLTNDDLGTLETAFNARHKNPRLRVVLRIFDRSLADNIENSFAIQVARSTSSLAAPYFVASAFGHNVITSFYAGPTPFVVTGLSVKAGHQLDGLTVRDLYARSKILVLAHRPSPRQVPGQQFAPPGDQIFVDQIDLDFKLDPASTVLRANDVIYFVGPYNRISKVYSLNDSLNALVG